MAIPELDLILGNLTKDTKFLSSDAQTREQIIAANVEVFRENNPDSDEFQAYDSGRKFNQEIRRQLGEGRKQTDQLVIQKEIFSILPENFSDLPEEDKLESLKTVRSQTEEIARKDLLNFEDVKFQLDATIDQTERQILGEDTGYVGDKFARLADGLVNSFVSPFDSEYAQKLSREWFPENPAYDESFWSKLSFGAGDFAGQTAMFIGTAALTGGAGATAGLFATNASRRFQENFSTAKALGLDDDQAVNAGIASLPGSVIDSFGDRLIVGRFLPGDATAKVRKQLAAASTNTEKAKILSDAIKSGINQGTFKRALRDAAAEGLSEAAGDYASGYGGYLATGYEEFVPTAGQLADSFAIGAILGGAASVAATPFGGRSAVKGIEQNQDQLDQLTEAARDEFTQKFESGDTEGALQVLQNFKKTKEKLERNQANVDARREQLQEIQEGGNEQRGTGQPQAEPNGNLGQGATPAPDGAEGQQVQPAGSGQIDQTQQVTNLLVKSISGDTSVEEQLDELLPQRREFRDKIINAKRKIKNPEDALTLLETALVKASQAAGLDPAQAYNYLNEFEITSTEAQTDKKEKAILLKPNADFDTLTEELGHVMRKSGILARAIGPQRNAALEREYGVKGEWNRDQEERFIDEFVNYLKSGRARNSVIQDVFDRVAQIFRDIYKNILIAVNPKTALEKRAVRRNNAYISPAAIDAITELFNIDVEGAQEASFVLDNALLKPAAQQDLQNLADRIRQAQEDALQRQGIGDVVRIVEEDIDALNAERAITEAVDKEIADWYATQALELGVSRTISQDVLDAAKEKLAPLGIGVIAPNDAKTYSALIAQAEYSQDVAEQQEERRQEGVDRVNDLTGKLTRVEQRAEDVRQQNVADRLVEDFANKLVETRDRLAREDQRTREILGPDATIEQEGLGAVKGITPIDDDIRNGNPVDLSKPFSYRGIAYDPKNGIGSIEANSNVNYRGFTAFLRVSDFLALNAPRQDDIDFVRNEIIKGTPIAPPVLFVEANNDKTIFRVKSHEGRGRAMALLELSNNPDFRVPVQVSGYNFRAKDLDKDLLTGSVFISDPEAERQKAVLIGQGVLKDETLYQEGLGGVKGITDIGQATNQSVTPEPKTQQQAATQPATNQSQEQKINLREKQVNYEGKAEVDRALRFIRNKKGKFENSEDSTLAGLLQYLGRNLHVAIGRGLLDDGKIASIIDGLVNFEQSRNVRRRDKIEQRLPTRKEIENAGLTKKAFDQSWAQSLVEQYEPILGPYTGDRNNLDAVRAWIYSHGPLEEAKGEGAPASEEMLQKREDVTNELVTTFKTPEEYLSEWEKLEGEIDNKFGARDAILEVVSNVFNHLVTVDTDNMTHRDAIVNFIAADTLLNVQAPGLIAKIGNQAYRNEVTQGALDREDTWSERMFNRFSKSLSVPLERTDQLNSRVSPITDTQRFFQNEVFGPFDQAVYRMQNAYREGLDRYIEHREGLYKALGFKKNDNRIASEHMHLSIALRIPQVEVGKDFNKSIVNNFNELDKSIENMRNKAVGPDKKIAAELEKAAERLKSFVNLDSPTLYEDLPQAIEQFLNYDGVSQEKIDARLEYLENIRSIFGDMRSGLKFITEAFRGERFQDFIDYAPTAAIEVSPGQTRQTEIDQDFLDGVSYDGYFKSGSKQVSEVKKRKGLGDNRYYDLNMDRYIPRQILGTLFEIYTTPSRFDLKHLYNKNSEFAKTVTKGNTDTLEFLKRTVIMQSENTLHRAQMQPDIVRAMNAIKGQLVKIHLGSVGKIIVEPGSSLFHYFAVRAFRPGYNTMENFGQALRLLSTRWGEYIQFLKTYNRDLIDRSATGELELDSREYPKMVTKLPIPRWMLNVKDVTNAITDNLLLPLRLGDGFASFSIFTSEYIRLLKQTGQATSDRDVDFSKPDFKLMNEAMRFTERFVGTSGPERRGYFFSDRDPKLAVIRNLLFSYQSHLTQLGQQAQRNVSNLIQLGKSKRPDLMVDAARDLGGILGQIAVFSSLRYATTALMAGMMVRMLKDLFDDEEGKLAELQKAIDEAPDKETRILAEQEYTQHRIVRDIINKFKNRTMSRQSFFKSVIRDQITGVHIFAGGANGLIPKIITELPDRSIAESYKDIMAETVYQMNEDAKELRRLGRDDEARKLLEDIENLKDQEYIPLFWSFPSESGIPGIYGSALDAVIAPAEDIVNATIVPMFGEKQEGFNFSDFYLHLQMMGVGQADINRYVKQINRIEREQWRQQKEFNKREQKRQERNPGPQPFTGSIAIPNL